jgi:NTE family protein
MANIKNRKKIGLALGSGGWKGIAHVGVIKALVENNIPIDFIAGSSVGSLVGGMYAALGDIYKVEEIINKFDKKDLFNIFADPSIKTGMIKGDKVVQFIEDSVGDVNIEDLKIPFCAIATDLLKGDAVYINKGSLSSAIRASSSIPLLFEVPTYKGNYLVDGGAVEMIPAESVKKMGADIVIGVNLFKNSFPVTNVPKSEKGISKSEIAFLTYRIILNRLSEYCEEKANVVIGPLIPLPLGGSSGLKWFSNFVEEKGIIKAGEEATLKLIPEIKKLLEER